MAQAAFAPWGEPVPCETSADCREAPFGDPRFAGIATCTAFAEGAPGVNVTGEPVCVCSIMFDRFGPACAERKLPESILSATVFILIGALALANLAQFSRLLVRGILRGLLRNRAVTWTVASCVFCSVTQIMWTWGHVLINLGQSWAGEVNIFGAGLTGMGISITISVCTLSWQEVINNASPSRIRTVRPLHKALAISGSVIIGLNTCYCLLTSKLVLALEVVLLYLVALFFVYLYVGCNLRRFLKVSSSDMSNDSFRAVHLVSLRIRRCINQVIAYIVFFTAGTIVFAIFSTTSKAKSFSEPIPARIGLYVMHFSTTLCCRWIFQCAAAPTAVRLRGGVRADATPPRAPRNFVNRSNRTSSRPQDPTEPAHDLDSSSATTK